MTIRRIDDGAQECTGEGRVYLGFPTGIATRRFGGADTVSLRNSSGLVTDPDGRIRPWPVDNFIEHEGSLTVIGPWIDGTLPFEGLPLDVTALERLIPAVRGLKAASFPLSGFYTRAFRWTPEGGVLVYPPKLSERVRELCPTDESERDWERWNHPDLTGEEAWSFSLGVMAWRILTGTDPFAGETGEDRRERIRRRVLPALSDLVPGLDEEASRIITGALLGTDAGRPGIDAWDHLIRRWARVGIIGTPPPGDAGRNRRQPRHPGLSPEARLRTLRRLRKSGWKYAIILAVLAVSLTVLSTPVRRALEIPATAGMSPVEVARTYYSAIDTLDSELLGDTLARGADSPDVRMVDVMYVTSRMRQAYEGTGAATVAAEWIREGRPKLPPGTFPWGVTDLELTDLGENRIEARYLFWVPPQGESPGVPEPLSRVDILSFTRGRKAWEISRIDRISDGMES